MSDNEREKAQLERDESVAEVETTLMLIEVSGRYESGHVSQFRFIREATLEDAAEYMRERMKPATDW